MSQYSLKLTLLVFLTTACGRSALPASVGVVDAQKPNAPPTSVQPLEQLAFVAGSELRIVSLDGSSRSVVSGGDFFQDAAGAELIGAGGYLLAETYRGNGASLLVASIDGTVKWQRTFEASGSDSPVNWLLQLGFDGTVAHHDYAPQTIDVTLLDQSHATLGGYFPIGTSMNGALPVRLGSTDTGGTPFVAHYGWWKAGTGTTLTGDDDYEQDAPGLDRSPSFFGARLVHLDWNGSNVALVARSATDTVSIDLPGAGAGATIGATDSQLSPTDQHWLLVATGETRGLLRVNLTAQTAEALTLSGPEGYWPFAACETSPSLESVVRIDTDGQVYAPFRNADHAAVFRSADGQHWSQVGAAVTGVGGLDVRVFGGTYVLATHVGAYCWSAGPQWSSPSSAPLSGNSGQVIRPATGAQLPPSTTRPSVDGYDRTGRYLAEWTLDNPNGNTASLHLTDIEAGSTKVLATGVGALRTVPVWLAAP